MDVGYEGTTAIICIYFLVILNILKFDELVKSRKTRHSREGGNL